MKTLRHTKQQNNKTNKQKKTKIEGIEPSQCIYQYVALITKGQDL